MLWVKILIALLVGFLLPCISYLIAKLGSHFTLKVYHKDDVHNSLTIKTLSILTAAAGGILVLSSNGLWSLMGAFVTILIMCTIAYFDILTGRIPITFLFIAVWVSILLSLYTSQWLPSMMGGLLNLLIGLGIHWLGRKYANTRSGQSAGQSAFGMGDVFAAGAMGILLGYPVSAYGFFLSLVFILVIAILRAAADRQPLLGINIRLGPGYLLATIVLLLFT